VLTFARLLPSDYLQALLVFPEKPCLTTIRR